MRFDGFDLNLMVALDTLLETRHVSAAARKLCMSQSAMSGALNRLREYFGDDLLVPVGKRMVPTPKAAELAEPVKRALMAIRSTVTTPTKFDPARSDRTYELIASDYVYAVLLTRAFAAASLEAPGVTFVVAAPDAFALERMERGEVDLTITLAAYLPPSFAHETLFEDELACICWSGNRTIGSTLTERDFFDCAHAVTYFGQDRRPALSETLFAQRGFERNIQVRVPTFSALPQAVVGTNRIATMHRLHAEYCARFWPIKVLPIPFDAPPVQEMAYMHPIRIHDQGLQWLLQHIKAAGREMTPWPRKKKALVRATR